MLIVGIYEKHSLFIAFLFYFIVFIIFLISDFFLDIITTQANVIYFFFNYTLMTGHFDCYILQGNLDDLNLGLK